MDLSSVESVVSVLAEIATVILAILAIWGDRIRTAVAGPKLKLDLRDTRGNLTKRHNQKKAVYYHITLTNERSWRPAEHVRLVVTGILKQRPGGLYTPEPLVAPLQLTWVYPGFHELLPTITSSDTCDLGYLDENTSRFTLALYQTPNNFTGYVAAGESMLVNIIASAHNYESKSPLVLRISWDGKWCEDMTELQQHLVIEKVP